MLLTESRLISDSDLPTVFQADNQVASGILDTQVVERSRTSMFMSIKISFETELIEDFLVCIQEVFKMFYSTKLQWKIRPVTSR